MRALLAIAMVLQLLVPVGTTRAAETNTRATEPTEATCCEAACCCADACACAVSRSLPERRPAPPPARDGKETAPLLALAPAGLTVALPVFAGRALRPAFELTAAASHNEIQARLCVWQT